MATRVTAIEITKPEGRVIFSQKFAQAVEEYRRIPICPKCGNEEPRPGGPYCDCKLGQLWKGTHLRLAANERVRDDERRKAAYEAKFGKMEVPVKFAGLSPRTLISRYGETTGKRGKVDAIKAAAAWAGVDLATNEVSEPTASLPGLFLYGEPGTGKSVLAWWAVQARGWGLWLTWNDLLGKIQNEWEGRERLIEAAQFAPVLFLDDLGDPYTSNGRVSDDRRNILFRFINYRLANGLPTIITSNINGGNLDAVLVNLERQFDQRIVDRLFELCHFVEMGGANLRKAPRKESDVPK